MRCDRPPGPRLGRSPPLSRWLLAKAPQLGVLPRASTDPERASEAGHKGGQASESNFKSDPERASEAATKAGQASGPNFANDREKTSEARRVGGQQSHGGGRKVATTASDA
ncbi:general stress protein [Pseudomonas putida]|uniref:General stress protein n=1 Tax=Pseudomonas putida TaxID=303 RepID=A0A7D5W0A0_PSEPU|nr:hypothetical protein DK184_13240 [Pseudomonas sp. RW405]QLJ16353.1 general stress protein [Pseudomonas putida]